MIDFDRLENQRDELRLQFLTAKPFPHLVLDDFCHADQLRKLVSHMPQVASKSRDFVFARNKFEKSDIAGISPHFAELHEELLSERLQKFLTFCCGEECFVDPLFHGGGVHQGGEGSFLDMHLDFNYHPLNPLWFRTLNMLLYLNDDWQDDWGGQLQLQDLRTGERAAIGVPFNRMVIQQTRGYTLHGYDPISFPTGRNRMSIASYAYSEHQRQVERPRTTDWFVKDDASWAKKMAAKVSKPLVKAKGAVFGSGTGHNR